MFTKCGAALALSLILNGLAAASTAQTVYSVSELGAKIDTLPKAVEVSTNSKKVIDQSSTKDTKHNAVVWYTGSGMINLGPLNLNNNRHLYTSDTAENHSLADRHIFIWHQEDDKMASLGTTDPDTDPLTNGSAVDSSVGIGESDEIIDSISHDSFVLHIDSAISNNGSVRPS